MARSRVLIKVGVALVVLAGLAFLFIRSVRDTRSEAYTIEPEHLRNWTLALEPGSAPTSPALMLKPPPGLANGLFRQIFARAMESLNMPSTPVLPLLLQGELDAAFAGRVTPEALLEVARSAGLEGATHQPRCLGYRRVSDPAGRPRQLYFALFESPAFERFRQQAAALLPGGDGRSSGFDPAALSPAVMIAAADPAFGLWQPLRANPQTDCVAPIRVAAAPPP
jgi:hypothetical protein